MCEEQVKVMLGEAIGYSAEHLEEERVRHMLIGLNVEHKHDGNHAGST